MYAAHVGCGNTMGAPRNLIRLCEGEETATQLLNACAVKTWLESLGICEAERKRPLIDLPNIGDNSNVSVDDISKYLFDKGVASNSISSLLDQMGELTRIANWYNRSEEVPSENETVNYLVVPLLRALGWTPQRMAIEWNRIDIAFILQPSPQQETFVCCLLKPRRYKLHLCLPYRKLRTTLRTTLTVGV